VTSATSRDVPFSPISITPTSPKLPWMGSFGEVGVMEFGLKGTSRLVADVTGSRHNGLGFTVFWLFTADFGSSKSGIRAFFGNPARSGSSQISGLIWVKLGKTYITQN